MSNSSKTYLQFVNSSLGLTDEENSELDYFPLPMYSYAIPKNEKWIMMLKIWLNIGCVMYYVYEIM